MGEKGRAAYSWKQRHGPCSVYHSLRGVRETLAQPETHVKIAQSPSCSLEADWDNNVRLIQTVLFWKRTGEKVGQGFSKLPQCPKGNWQIAPPPPQLLISRVPQVQLGQELVWGPPVTFSPDCLESLTPETYASKGSLSSSVVPCRPDMEPGEA